MYRFPCAVPYADLYMSAEEAQIIPTAGRHLDARQLPERSRMAFARLIWHQPGERLRNPALRNFAECHLLKT
jgi:hypothetical protein